jgi:uncharacterized protein (DUF2236 family)
VLDERSVIWRYAGDVRSLLLLGRAFLLQVMHPTIGAGVGAHSTFRSDPFGRLQRSWWLVLRSIYGPEGERVGRGVREAHRHIRGIDRHGRRYHAYEPEAYWWVVATGFDSLVAFSRLFFPPLSPDEERVLYGEARELGRRFGVRDASMPQTLDAFRHWYASILDTRLEYNPTVGELLETLSRPAPPQWFPRPLWPPLQAVAGRVMWLTTLGRAPWQARELLGIDWNLVHEAQLRALSQSLRPVDAMPARVRYLPPARDAFARAARSPSPEVGAVESGLGDT